MKTFAVLEENIVVNKVVGLNKETVEEILNQVTDEDGNISLLSPYKYTCIEYVTPEIGDIWTGTTFTKPE